MQNFSYFIWYVLCSGERSDSTFRGSILLNIFLSDSFLNISETELVNVDTYKDAIWSLQEFFKMLFKSLSLSDNQT